MLLCLCFLFHFIGERCNCFRCSLFTDAQVSHELQSGAKNQVHKRLCRVQRYPQRLWRASGVPFKPLSPSHHLLASPFALAEQQRSISCCSLSSSSGSSAEFPTACFPITHHIWDEGTQQPHMEITCSGEFSLTISELEQNLEGMPKEKHPLSFPCGHVGQILIPFWMLKDLDSFYH